jgi:hypothetical protein
MRRHVLRDAVDEPGEAEGEPDQSRLERDRGLRLVRVGVSNCQHGEAHEGRHSQEPDTILSAQGPGRAAAIHEKRTTDERPVKREGLRAQERGMDASPDLAPDDERHGLQRVSQIEERRVTGSSGLEAFL